MDAMTQPATHELDALLAHAAWVRDLARSLARDAALADDVAQETWLAALEHAPDRDVPPRAWLGTVALNVVRLGRRARARRTRREELAAQDEALPAADTTVAALELQQELARRVLALDEPYRSTIHQRYYDGLPPREIARRSGVPVKTVKTRLARGLAQLRADLDASRGGDRTAWLSALVPFLGRGQAATLYLGVLVMNAKLVWFAAGLAVCLAAAVTIGPFSSRASDNPASNAAIAEGVQLDAPPVETSPLAPESVSPARGAAAQTKDEPPAVATPLNTAPPGHGRVLDAVGAPLADVDVAALDEWDARTGRARGALHVLARTDASGGFELAAQLKPTTIGVAHPDWITVLAGRTIFIGNATRWTIVAAPRNPIAGIVAGKDGVPVAGAELWIEESDSFLRDLGVPLDNAQEVFWHAQSDAQGRFSFPDAPRIPGSIVVQSPAHKRSTTPLPQTPVSDLVLTLESVEAPHVLVSGRVVDLEHRPVADAHVSLGNRMETTGADGAFRFDLSAPGEGSHAALVDGVWRVQDDRTALRAVKTGHLPAFHTLPPFAELDPRAPLAPIELVLGGEPLSISGRVIDAHGDGVPGVGVEVLDLTVFGQQTSSSAGRGIVSWLVYCEELLQPDRERGSVVTQTNEKGEFAIGGLLDREYTLFAADAQTLRRVELEGVRGGARGVEVRMPAAAELTHVAGRVVGRDGTPIPGATVCATFSRPGPNQHTTPDVVTDASGAFDLGALETESLGFRVLGDHLFVVFWRPLGAGEDPGRLELVVSRRAFVQLDLSERPGFADHFAPLDAKGETRGVMLFMGNAIAFPEQIEMEGDKSDVVAVEEDTRLLALWKDGKEVARVPVNAVAGETVVVKP